MSCVPAPEQEPSALPKGKLRLYGSATSPGAPQPFGRQAPAGGGPEAREGSRPSGPWSGWSPPPPASRLLSSPHSALTPSPPLSPSWQADCNPNLLFAPALQLSASPSKFNITLGARARGSAAGGGRSAEGAGWRPRPGLGGGTLPVGLWALGTGPVVGGSPRPAPRSRQPRVPPSKSPVYLTPALRPEWAGPWAAGPWAAGRGCRGREGLELGEGLPSGSPSP